MLYMFEELPLPLHHSLTDVVMGNVPRIYPQQITDAALIYVMVTCATLQTHLNVSLITYRQQWGNRCLSLALQYTHAVGIICVLFLCKPCGFVLLWFAHAYCMQAHLTKIMRGHLERELKSSACQSVLSCLEDNIGKELLSVLQVWHRPCVSVIYVLHASSLASIDVSIAAVSICVTASQH